MSARIYLEGGGNSKELHSRCREGFRKLLERSGFAGRMPRLVACGGRDQVFEDFCADHSGAEVSYVAMWIDSEEELRNPENAWEHLENVQTVSKWKRPAGAADEQVLFMTTCMETWIVADRHSLGLHYGRTLQTSALPPLDNIETRSRHEVQDALVRATRNCSNAYAKGKRAFEILGKLERASLEGLPSYARLLRILDEHL